MLDARVNVRPILAQATKCVGRRARLNNSHFEICSNETPKEIAMIATASWAK